MAGIHGVGKTFLGKPIAESLGLQYATASALIREEMGGKENWNISKKTKGVNENQELLISSVNRIVNSKKGPLVLDGHFVLRNEKGNLVAITTEVFQRLKISSAILLEAPSNVVAERLALRGESQKIEEISMLAEAERENAEAICKAMGIMLEKISSPSSEEMVAAFKRAIL